MCASAACVAVSALFVLLAAEPQAQGVNVFVERDIAVDVAAQDAVTARQEAIEQAQREGLNRLLTKLALPEQRAQLPEIAALDVERYVASYSVQQEQVLSQRYIATLSVTYDGDAIDQLLGGRNIAQIEAPENPMLVLPLFEAPDANAQLWPENNPWFSAWLGATERAGLVRTVLPLGDLSDATTVSPEQAAALDQAALDTLAERYAVDHVIIARARPNLDASPQAVSVRLSAVGPRLSGPLDGFEIIARPGQDSRDLLGEAAGRAQAALEDAWRQGTVRARAQAQALDAIVPINDLPGWLRTRAALEQTDGLTELRVKQLSRAEALITLRYLGDLQALRQSLAANGLSATNQAGRLIIEAGAPNASLFSPQPLPPLSNNGSLFRP